MNNPIKSIGVDLSLTGTGLVCLEDGKLIEQKLIKSKPSGDRPIDELKRILTIAISVQNFIDIYKPDIVVIENLAFGIQKTTSLTQLAGLNYFIRSGLYKIGIKFVLVAPTTLKKYVTGNGAAKKDVLMVEVYKRLGVTMLDDNLCDAYSLAQIGLSLLGGNSKDTNKIQKEVISLITKQL